MRTRPTPEQKAAKAEARAAERQERHGRRERFRAWVEERRVATAKAAREARQERLEAPRGRDRVPEWKKVPAPRHQMKTPPVGTGTTPDGRSLQGPYRDRRAAGARGRHSHLPRTPRRRDMPVAVARREARQAQP